MKNKELERDLMILSCSGHSKIGGPYIGATGHSISKPLSGPIIIGRKAHKLALFDFRKQYRKFIGDVKSRERNLG